MIVISALFVPHSPNLLPPEVLVGDEALQLLVAPNVARVEEDLWHARLPRPLGQPIPNLRREPVESIAKK